MNRYLSISGPKLGFLLNKEFRPEKNMEGTGIVAGARLCTALRQAEMFTNKKPRRKPDVRFDTAAEEPITDS